MSEKELKDYDALTYLTVEQVHRAYEMFENLGATFRKDDRNPAINVETVLNSPEINLNPFKDRIVSVFSESRNFMTFEEYVHMFSVFSEMAPESTKAYYAFKIYDFNADNLICSGDLKEMIRRLKGVVNLLSPWIYDETTDHVLAESDLDKDGFLNFPEFEHRISKNPAFLSSFRILI